MMRSTIDRNKLEWYLKTGLAEREYSDKAAPTTNDGAPAEDEEEKSARRGEGAVGQG
jgi:hypothetical protein